MLDFEVQRFTRRCAGTDRELQPGELYFSVLVPQGSSVVRFDYSQQAWKGSPDNALGWWQSRVPDPNTRRVQWAPNSVMVQYFLQLAEDPSRRDELYVLTLLMIRRRILRQEELETDAEGQEWIRVFCARNEAHYRVPVVMPDDGRATQIQAELSAILLGGAADPDDSTSPHSNPGATSAGVEDAPADG